MTRKAGQVIGTGPPDVSAATADPGTGAARALIRRAQELSAALGDALAAPARRRQEAQQAYGKLRLDAAADELAKMPLERIKDVTQGRLMLGAIEKAGFRTVGSVLTAGPSALDTVPGVGPQTAAQVVAAARQIAAALAGRVTVRIDPDRRTMPQASLLGALHAYERAQANVPPRAPDPVPLKEELDTAVAQAGPAGSRLRMFFSGAGRKQAARDALARLHAVLGSPRAAEATARLRPGAPSALTAGAPGPTELWNDFLARPVAYNGLLADVAGLGPDQESAEGFLPAEIADRVRDQPLDLSLVTASLRGYQAFGAKFALVQRRVIIGDEMGLGKTVQALAAMAHLAATREAATREAAAADGAAPAVRPVHFLVVCPASVVVNWIREITKHTTLTAHKLHGPGRDQARQRWLGAGGVAVTTYEALRSLAGPGAALDPDGAGPAPAVPLAMMIVDEAHYAKNAAALRTKAVRAWANATARVLFLTGTPMENRVDEFRTLVGHLRPDVATTVTDADGVLGGTRFRRAVAPVYLRRNQDDVLAELPPRLETSDWVDLDGRALAAYREAVAEGNFMKMRRAAFAVGPVVESGAVAGENAAAGISSDRAPDDSKKLQRLLDIVDEATDDGRKVVVFSFFRTVLDTVMAALGDRALGPITGDVPPPQRQALVDQF